MIIRTILFTLLTLFTIGESSSQVIIGAETRNFQNYKVSLDLKKKLHKDIYLSSWSAYQSRDRQYPRLSAYVTSLNLINFKLGKRAVFSTGYQYYYDQTYNFKFNAWLNKVEVKLF